MRETLLQERKRLASVCRVANLRQEALGTGPTRSKENSERITTQSASC